MVLELGSNVTTIDKEIFCHNLVNIYENINGPM